MRRVWKVDIYLETDSKVQKNIDRRCGYVLETICAGAIRTVEGFSRISGTYHSVNLQNLADALSRITKTSRICVHTEDAYVAAHIRKLSEMAETDWKDSKGSLIRNADLWKKIWELAEKHRLDITANTDKHSYSGWLQEQMAAGRCEKDVEKQTERKVMCQMSGYHY